LDIAYLNHDDAWLGDHLASGISMLGNSEFDFYLGGTAFSRYRAFKNNSYEIFVDYINTNYRKEFDFFVRKTSSYEPASSWIIKMDMVRQIGPWQYYSDLYRFPIEDYLLRAIRLNCRFYFSSKITVWSFGVHNMKIKGGKAYDYLSSEYEIVGGLVLNNTSEEIRNILKQKFIFWKNLVGNRKKEITEDYSKKSVTKNVLKHLVLNQFTFQLFKIAGVDPLVIAELVRFQKKGAIMKKSIIRRTGIIPNRPDMDKIIKELKSQLL
jgi:hypothetical protein